MYAGKDQTAKEKYIKMNLRIYMPISGTGEWGCQALPPGCDVSRVQYSINIV